MNIPHEIQKRQSTCIAILQNLQHALTVSSSLPQSLCLGCDEVLREAIHQTYPCPNRASL